MAKEALPDGIFVTFKGKQVFVPVGKSLDEVSKASYMTASQESPVKLDLSEAPHYITTAREMGQTMGFNARVGEDVRYDYGMKKGILITVERSFAKILTEDRTGYVYKHVSDVKRSDDFTKFGLWEDIPINFREKMLRIANIPVEYTQREWDKMPRIIKDTLKDDSVFETTARTGTQSNPTAITDYDGVKETVHEKQKHGDAKNPEHSGMPGLSGQEHNPNNNKRRDGRQVVDNEEQNNTFSAGEEKPEEPYSVNITGGSNFKEDYGNSLQDWRAADPKPSKDVKQTFNNKVDSGATSVSGENRPISENPHEVEKTFEFGVTASDAPSYGVRYLSKEEAQKFLDRKKRDL